jgi:hypothetical protein
VRLIATELANNHMNKHIKNAKEKKKTVVLQEAHHPVEVHQVEGLPEGKVQKANN